MPSPTQSNQIQAQAGEPTPIPPRPEFKMLLSLNQFAEWEPSRLDPHPKHIENTLAKPGSVLFTLPASSSPSSKQEDDPANYPDPRFKWDGKPVEVRGSVVWFKPAGGNGEHGWGQFNPYEAKRLALFINSAIAPPDSKPPTQSEDKADFNISAAMMNNLGRSIFKTLAERLEPEDAVLLVRSVTKPDGRQVEQVDFIPGLPDIANPRVRACVETMLAALPGDDWKQTIDKRLPSPPSPEPQPVEAGWRERCEVVDLGDSKYKYRWMVFHEGAALSSDGQCWYQSRRCMKPPGNFVTEAEARAALSKAPQPPDIKPESSQQPASKQEDDREWEKRRMPIPTDPDTVAWAERSIAAEAELASLREREMDPRRRLPVVGEVYKEPSGRTAVEVVSVAKGSHSNVYIGRVELSGTTNEIRSPLDNVTLDEWWHWVNRAHLIGFKPPDSKPPTQSEDHIADAGKMVEPTKPTQSVQPWPEDLSVLHNARLRMRSKRFGDRGVIVVKVTGVSDSVYGRMVEDEDCAYPIQNFDLLSVSPPLESKPQSKSSRPMTPEELNDLKEFVAEHPWMSQPQSVQSEGKVRWFKHKTDKNMVWESVGRYGRWHHLDGSIEESGLGIESFTTDESYEEFFPTQPKDSKEMGPEWLPEGMGSAADMAARYAKLNAVKGMGGRTEYGLVGDALSDRDSQWRSALKSANERAEAAEKKNIELESKVTEAYTQGVAEGRAAQ